MEHYIQQIAEIVQEPPASVKEKMDKVQRLYGLTYKEYYQNELYLLSEGLLTKKALKLQQRKHNRKMAFDVVIKKSGMRRGEIIQQIKEINEKNICKINIYYYEKFCLYKLNEEELEQTLYLLTERNERIAHLKEALKLVDQGKLTYSELQPEFKRLKELIKSLTTDDFRKKIRKNYFLKRKDGSIRRANTDRIITDMEFTRLLLGFSYSEYISFRFDKKRIKEKRTYISNRERMQVLSMLNCEEGSDLLNDKVKSYHLLSPYYRRKQVFIRNQEDYPVFEQFCHGKNVFVKKSVALSMGKGIEPIYLEQGTDLYALMCSILEASGSFVAEEMISLHKKIKVLNPSSVNTVRMETYYDGKKTVFGDAFMRVGQSGAFVDNAGAGGIFVAVDPKNGKIISDGFDEYGNVYLTHPDTGMAFKGYKLPGWFKLRHLCRKISSQVPGVTFIGWDLAYTDKRKWVIVEGNAKPQIICNQTSQGKGLRREFLQRVGLIK